MKLIVALSVLLALTGCQTIQERLAKRVNCDPKQLLVTNELKVPAYQEYHFTCEGRDYMCRDAPFHSQCEQDTHKKKDAPAATATPTK